MSVVMVVMMIVVMVVMMIMMVVVMVIMMMMVMIMMIMVVMIMMPMMMMVVPFFWIHWGWNSCYSSQTEAHVYDSSCKHNRLHSVSFLPVLNSRTKMGSQCVSYPKTTILYILDKSTIDIHLHYCYTVFNIT